jgi:phosphate transport system protein
VVRITRAGGFGVSGLMYVVRLQFPQHSSRDFETELTNLRSHLLAMGARCERIVGLAFDAYMDGASEMALGATALDAQIDRDDLDNHALILRILALRQPVAADLRYLAAALRMLTDLERVGDEAVNIAERAVEGDGDAKHLVRDELRSMAASVLEMLRSALRAFVQRDDEAADRVLESDDDVDRRCAAVIAKMTTHMSEHASAVPSGLRVVRVAKYLERIADHATNVAEEAIFMVRGDDVRHGQWQAVARPRAAGGSAAAAGPPSR